MGEAIEGIGDAITGGVVARAVEPSDGEAGHTHETACLNCGTELGGSYCHACGQGAHVHRTLTAFSHDLLHGVLHFEGKIWRTLPMLAWRPGDLTRRYVAGERARFVSPLALFLFSVFLMFAVMSWTSGSLEKAGSGLQQSMVAGIAENERDIAALEKERTEAIAAKGPTISIDAKLEETREELAMLRTMQQRGIGEASIVRVSDAPAWIEAALKKANANPSLLLYKLQNNAYKYSWALIPISVPFMWLLFPFSHRFRLYDHAVFVTYSLCFMTLLAVVLSLVRAATGPGVIGPVIAVVPAIHIYRQLRGAYRLRWWSALLRTVVLLIFCVVTLTVFLLMLVALGVLG